MSWKTKLLALFIVVMAGVAIWLLWPTPSQIAHVPHGRIENGIYYPAPRTKTAGCVIRDALPDPECTPGAVDRAVTVEIVCTQKTTARRRTKASIEEETFSSYNTSRAQCKRETKDKKKKGCENDHDISIELGGADNEIANHFPQLYEDEDVLEEMSEKFVKGEMSWEQLVPYLGAHAKDKVENWLHHRVCQTWHKTATKDEMLSLAEAQMKIAEGWTIQYREWLRR